MVRYGLSTRRPPLYYRRWSGRTRRHREPIDRCSGSSLGCDKPTAESSSTRAMAKMSDFLFIIISQSFKPGLTALWSREKLDAGDFSE